MQEVFRAIGRLAQSQATVLITGESGTGKELVAARCTATAHAPRNRSSRSTPPRSPKDLLESELFGHERGSFTGAQAMRRGRFEQAEGGTLFLDEIGDMPPDLQTRLLRVLSDNQFYRVGGHTPMAANVRVIAATHQELESRVKQGLFREDLYHRLNVIRLRLPALRERREDIAALAGHFLAKSARDLGVEGKRLTDAAGAVPPGAGMARQRAAARERVSLAHRHGAGTSGGRERPAARGARRGDVRAAGEDGDWRRALEREVAARLARGESDIADPLTRDFETVLIMKACSTRAGGRIEGRGPCSASAQHAHPQGAGAEDRYEGLGLSSRNDLGLRAARTTRRIRRAPWRAGVVALVLVATQLPQRAELRLGLHALGDLPRGCSECAMARIALMIASSFASTWMSRTNELSILIESTGNVFRYESDE
jgi:two-component system nitrogen regulation response regulator GlnG